MSIKSAIVRRAVKTTARHTAHGTASKLRREPVRTTTLLALGGLLGGLVGWFAARSAASSSVSGA